ncbi:MULTISPECIES: hypothetical protein [Corynebacterium]|uniref:Uncharacterized protein n=1 Tax=Corynebacterium hadale TaxID=2026255 RepID=A0A269PEL0_9CORY|nr:hypothetical protein [Corynebacterium hadale]PAJ70557.1 hypothetical protein CIG21_04450 [Corynebacterium hadale]WKC59985.1 hypothetical protein CHAD_05510 [Corynebacterium hadale]
MAAKQKASRGLAVAMCCVALAVGGCAGEDTSTPLDQARAANQSRHVSTAFDDHPVVLDDTNGLVSSEYFFNTSETLVVSDSSVEAQLRAASIAAYAHAPMLVYDEDHHGEITQEVKRLKTFTLLTVGDVAIAPASGSVRVYRDPGGVDALGKMTSVRFHERPVHDPADAQEVIADLDTSVPTWLHANWAEPQVMPNAVAKPFPVHSRRDADMAPQVVATRASSIASIANARAFGARVTMVDNPDPRESEDTLLAMAGLADAPLIALGTQFEPASDIPERIMQAEEKY